MGRCKMVLGIKEQLSRGNDFKTVNRRMGSLTRIPNEVLGTLACETLQ